MVKIESKNLNDRKVIVFEYLSCWHFLVIMWYRLFKYETYFLTSSISDLEVQRSLFARMTKGMRHLALPQPLYRNNDPSADLAFRIVDDEYERPYFGKASSTEEMVRLYGSPDIRNVYKKQLLLQLTDQLHAQLIADQLRGIFPKAKEIVLVPYEIEKSAGYDKLHKRNPEISYLHHESERSIKQVWWVALLAWLLLSRRKLRVVMVCSSLLTMAPIYFLGSMARKREIKDYKLGIAVNSPRQFNADYVSSVRGVDFLLDGKELRKDNTLFLPQIKINEGDKRRFSDQNLQLFDSRLAPSFRSTVKVIYHSIRVLTCVPFIPTWAFSVTVYSIKNYWYWSSVQRLVKLQHFVSAGDFGTAHISRNIILKNEGIQTWYYLDTENLGALYLPDPGELPHLHQFWGYLYYDNCVAWSKRLVEYFESHQQTIGRYFSIGCLWSEHIREIKEGATVCNFMDDVKAAGYISGQKLLAVFDSSYSNRSRTTYDDGVEFAKAILGLLDNNLEIFVLWKEKKMSYDHPLSEAEDLISLYKVLEAHPRCLFVGTSASTAEVTAVSDITVSFPFTSTTIEALGAGCKAMYYLPNDKFKGSVFESIPYLTVKDHAQLQTTVSHLLYSMSDEQYNQHVNKFCKSKVERFLDGRALTRFRQLLTANPNEICSDIKPTDTKCD